MANVGFSAPTNYWGTIPGLTPKSSSKGQQNSFAEAKNSKGDVVASDVYGKTFSPSVEYVVTDDFTNDNDAILLGKVVSFTQSGTTRKLMITQVVVNTSAGSPPTVTISGVQVENSATTNRTYPIEINLTPRSKSQDVAGAIAGQSVRFTQITTTYSVDPAVQTVGGWPVSSDCANGKVEVSGSFIYSDWGKAEGWDVISAADESSPDGDYTSKSITLTKYLSGTDA